MSLSVLSFVPSGEVMVPGGLVYHTPLVQTSSGGHRGRRYASYRNTFLLNLLCCREKYRDSYDEGNCVQGDGKRSSELINILASRGTEEDKNILSSCLQTATR